MTAANLLTLFDFRGKFLFDPLTCVYTEAMTAPIERTGQQRDDSRFPHIPWRGLTARRDEQSDGGCRFWQSLTLDQHAAAQNAPEKSSLDVIAGAWPPDGCDDGFDVALRQWRDQGMDRHR